MEKVFLPEFIKYDGRQLSSLWAFRNFGIQGDSIVAFRGPCHVELTEMVDLADVRARAHIHSEEMVHFIIEHFDMDLEKAVTRQRLFIAITKDLLEARSPETRFARDGDDIFVGDRKLSVSIATLSPVSSLIHTGINIRSDNTPVKTIGLADLGIDSETFAREAIETYSSDVEDIRLARCKVRGVG